MKISYKKSKKKKNPINKIPVIINNRDLLTWTQSMLSKIKKLTNVGEIFIIDNDSTYEPLLEWYKTKPCNIIKEKNLGHTAPWQCGLVEKLCTPYVVTDPDLGLDDIPLDTLVKLKEKLDNNPSLGKVGLKLNWELVSESSPYYPHLQNYEKKRWENSNIEDEVYVNVKIDTTFAMYNAKRYFIGGGSLSNPYVARHYPWEFINEQAKENIEFEHYISNASYSSSYKKYMGL